MTERRPPAQRRRAAPATKRSGARPKPPGASKGAGRRPGASRSRGRRADAGRSILWRWRRGIFMVGLLSVAAWGGVAAVVFNIALPPEEPLLQTSFVCSADVTEACGPDNAIASFSAEEDRTNVRLSELPQVLVDAVLATEDQDYYRHRGIDPVGITRALYNDLRGRGLRQGGSTITQQYVKNVYLTSERSVVRKIKEAVLAVKLERELDKDQILERYLNTIYFGRGAYGVAAASRAYFAKDIRQVSLAEASYLASLIRAPESADALAAPDEAARRRQTVLAAMAQEGYITVAERDAVAARPIEEGVIPRRDRTGLGEVRGNLAADNIGTKYFVEAVRREIAANYGEDTLWGGGLRIYTTLDFDMQRAAWDAVTSTLDREGDPAAALVAVDQYGFVKAMVGGRDFDTSQVNLALGARAGGTGRGAGSAFKGFVLAETVRQGISLNSKFASPGQMTFPKANAGEDWNVRNYGETEQGVLDVVDATRVSSNTFFAQLMLRVGAANVVDMAHRLGVEAELPAVPSLALGTGDVSPLDMAVGYSTFANRGVHNDPVLISKIEQVDGNGRVTTIHQSVPSGERVLTEQQADLVTHCLRQVVLGGTGSGANIGRPAAGKTGTTQDNKDAWFVGYTPKLTAAVWMGYPDPDEDGNVPTMNRTSPVAASRGLNGVTGGSLPAEIWRKFMRAATADLDTGTFVAPTAFPGEVLNQELESTTTTEATTTTEETTTTESTTTTTSSSTTSTTSTTTTVPEVTTTTEPDEEPDPPIN